MRLLIPVLIAAWSSAIAGSSSEATATPNVIARMVQGLVDSKIDHLTSKTYTESDQVYSYHLKIIDYLGIVKRDRREYTIAAAKFIRSSAKNSEYPPARGHGFLLIFDDSFRVVTHGRMDYGDYHMDGDVLKSADSIIADFATSEPVVRYHGWLLDSAFMPYPFADKISEADWESGAFQKKP